jgi:hypothetical protein
MWTWDMIIVPEAMRAGPSMMVYGPMVTSSSICDSGEMMAVGCCFIVLPGKRKGFRDENLTKNNDIDHREDDGERKEKSAEGEKDKKNTHFLSLT